MPTYKTPGVYVEEISTLPPSVAEVATAVPAFIGHTEKVPEDGSRVVRIDSLLEFRELFGSAKPTAFQVTTGTDASSGARGIESVASSGESQVPEYLLYYCISSYFLNGGGSCWIVSVGDYESAPDKGAFEEGLRLIEKEDEPTMILLTDAVKLSTDDYYSVCQQALMQCGKLRDRFAILDVLEGDDDAAAFRQNIGTNDLMFGAAYTPYLRTSMSHHYTEDGVTVEDAGGSNPSWALTVGPLAIAYTGAGTPEVRIVQGDANEDLEISMADTRLTIRNTNGRDAATVVAHWDALPEGEKEGFSLTVEGAGTDEVQHTGGGVQELIQGAAGSGTTRLSDLETTETALYQEVRAQLTAQRVVLPPSAAMAGIYAATDRKRGVWKAPANVSVAGVIAPMAKITDGDQENLNVDPTAGKSINAIREFTGKGTLVWGARTLAGNDNEWRYVPVRRLFNMIEESSKKSTSFAVFEPNDATTWLKVKGMIESYLYGLWERGALAGPTPEAAYFVNVGLGKTMTTQDVLEGRMIVEIGVAAVRPAEFIILRFSHKLQEA